MNKEIKTGDTVKMSFLNSDGKIVSEETKVKYINQYGFYVLENGQTARTIN